MTAMSNTPAPAGQSSALLVLLRARTFIALILVTVFFSVFAPNFLSAANLVIMSKHVAPNAFLAIGMTFVIVSGGIDLSVGSIVGLCGMVAGYLVLNGIDLGLGWSIQFNTLEICLMVVAVGVLIAAYIASRTPLGRYIYAVGGNERAAGLSGVKVNRVKYFVYMFSGLCGALVGIIISSQLVAAHPATGDTFELNAIAAAVLGGTSMAGGRGRIGGTIIGAFVIGVLSDGLVMMGVSSFWQTVIKGLVIIAAVVIDQAQQRVQARVALQAQAAIQ